MGWAKRALRAIVVTVVTVGAVSGLFLGIIAAQTGTFPDVLYQLPQHTGQITGDDFRTLGTSLAATQAVLGQGMAKVPTEHGGCLIVVEDDGLTPLREFPTWWRAPKAGRLTEVYCDTTGGTSAVVDIKTAAGVVLATVACTPAGVTVPLTVPLAAKQVLRAQIVQVTGVPTSASACVSFTPGA